MDRAPSHLRAVILAAGDGGRMRGHTTATPKPLVPLNGRPIVEYTLEALVAGGVTEALVVTGYREAQVRAALAGGHEGLSLTFVTNPRFHAGASYSLAAARPIVGDAPFLLVMADHVLSARLIERLRGAAAADPGRCFVAADSGPRDDAFSDEATKLALGLDGSIIAIGKQLPRWDALDAGAFVLTPAVWDAAATVPEDCELSVIMSELVRRRQLFAADVTGASWYDIDTEEDLQAAAAVVAGR
ncbi:MAG: hypothetical protein C0506_13860 [Anaerolinea sp.]|nr:hypothetical protein [Anaerolinea sp.]